MNKFNLFGKESIIKYYDEWEISIINHEDSILFNVSKEKEIYENNFKFESLKNLKIFIENNTIKEIIDSICRYINNKNIQIKKYLNDTKLIIIFSSDLIKKNSVFILERQEFNLDKINPKFLKLTVNKTINTKYDNIQYLACFPSGKMISVFKEKTIIIWDKNYEPFITLTEENKEPKNVYCNLISIKDENNFATCYSNFNMKLWRKVSYNEYKIYLLMEKIHKSLINDILYPSNGNIITCSNDKTIKIWEKKNEKSYQCLTILKQSDFINSILLFEDKNILVSSGTRFWDYNNFQCFSYIKDDISIFGSILCKINNDIIIIGRDKIKVVSISKKKVIKYIENKFNCRDICKINNKDLVIILDSNNDIRLYTTNNFEEIQFIGNIYLTPLLGICDLKNNSIALYTYDGKIHIWNLDLKEKLN